jgi:hypothetical protein
VCAYAPVGQTSILRDWWPHAHLSALGAIAPAGTLDCQGQDRARLATAVDAFVAPLLREVAGQGGLIWDGAPSPRRRALQAGWAPSAAQRLPLERLPAYLADFQEVLAWWRKRKHLLGGADDSPAPTDRWTLHIEKPFIEKIKAEAEAEHVTVTEIINRIIRHYYAGG